MSIELVEQVGAIFRRLVFQPTSHQVKLPYIQVCHSKLTFDMSGLKTNCDFSLEHLGLVWAWRNSTMSTNDMG